MQAVSEIPKPQIGGWPTKPGGKSFTCLLSQDAHAALERASRESGMTKTAIVESLLLGGGSFIPCHLRERFQRLSELSGLSVKEIVTICFEKYLPTLERSMPRPIFP